jgi:murein hydrolase activator
MKWIFIFLMIAANIACRTNRKFQTLNIKDSDFSSGTSSIREPEGMTAHFEASKGSLPWPAEGVIGMHFGKQKYGALDKITINNPGITIETKAREPVQAVFDGKVVSVPTIGPVEAVIIKHGNYFTTYSNLESVKVVKGQWIKRGQLLGRVAEIEGKANLEFIISNNANLNLNPEKWLR